MADLSQDFILEEPEPTTNDQSSEDTASLEAKGRISRPPAKRASTLSIISVVSRAASELLPPAMLVRKDSASREARIVVLALTFVASNGLLSAWL